MSRTAFCIFSAHGFRCRTRGMSSPESTIAFIGLGVMGYPMASNLRSKVGKDTTMVIYDTNRETLDRFNQEMSVHGPVTIVKDSFEAIKRANTLISVMPSNEAVKAVHLDPESGSLAGAAAHPSQRKLIIECGTVSQSTILEVAKAASKTQTVDFIDAPISGGPAGSLDGTLSFMVGSDSKDVFDKALSLLVHMGKLESIFHCGGVGAGSASKIINNYVSLISVLAVSEGYDIASRLGMNLETLTKIFNASSAQCWVTSKNNPVPGITPNSAASRNYDGGFRLELALKDLRLGKELAETVGARAALNHTTVHIYSEAANDPRYKGKDARVLYKFLQEN